MLPSAEDEIVVIKSLADSEREIIIKTLLHFNGNRTQTARALKIGIRTIQRKIKTYGLEIPSMRPGSVQ